MTGMGRTGRNFAVEHWNFAPGSLAPDISSPPKDFPADTLPSAPCCASKKVVDAIANGSGSFMHGFTYNAHPVSLAAGRAVLKFLQDHKLVQAADSSNRASIAAKLQSSLQGLLDLDNVGDVRGLGLLWGVEFVADKKSKRPFDPQQNFAGRVGQLAAQRGLLVYPMQGCVDGISGDHLLIAPPAVINAEEIDWAVAQLRDTIAEAGAS